MGKKILFSGLLLVVLLFATHAQASDKGVFEDLTSSEFTEKMKSLSESDGFMIIDVRTPEEFRSERIKGAVNINRYASGFDNEIDKLDRNKTYFIYCRSGNRSGQVKNIMKKMGFKEVYNLKNGITSDTKSLDLER